MCVVALHSKALQCNVYSIFYLQYILNLCYFSYISYGDL
jgi:hypothetical protein